MASEPRLVSSAPRVLVGMHRDLPLADPAVAALWRAFMPRLGEIAGRADADLVSVLVRRVGASGPPVPGEPVTRWAAATVVHDAPVPPGMRRLVIPAGEYAVFAYRGTAAGFGAAARYVYADWLPGSGWRLDDRPGFEVLPPGYRPDDPEAEEQVWVPVRRAGRAAG